MRILMIAPTPFMADRGCHTQILLEVQALQGAGHEVLLCTYGLGRDVPGVKTVRCAVPFWYRKLSAGPSYTKIILLPVLTLTALRTLFRFRPDVVHAHLHEGALIARVCQFFYRNARYVFDMQGSLTGECVQHGFVRRGSIPYRLLAWLEGRIVKWFPTITQSETMVSELLSFGVPPERIANVKDGVDTILFRPLPFDRVLAKQLGVSSEKPCVLYMGLLTQYQGVDVMLEAFQLVCKRQPETQFLIIGFPHIEEYRAKAEKLGIGKNIIFLGRIDYFGLPPYLSLAPISIAPKIATTEGDGKIYNYMAMGMTTIAFDRSVSREILGNTGVFAKMNDAKDLAEKITWAIENPSQAKAFGDQARRRAQDELSADAVGKRIEAFYALSA